ncbi:MAG: uroporphyrinogen-III C-methyltransferase [Thermodesulfobacteriota bacterium]|nr:uroporphyrinogen-III C-methyltransferase [Thermodesulfobacteriota bacterium]
MIKNKQKSGKVYLVGAGPGDPGLFTIKGKEILEKAEIIIYDYHIGEDILNFASPHAKKIYAGKRGGERYISQERINSLMVEKAKAGFIVVRLKGGDPFLLGRGGEEALYLKEKGVEFEIIPGVTSALAVPAYTGIPVTHRGKASIFCVITGHEGSDKESSHINYKALAELGGTLVFLMGIKNIDFITKRLMENGLAGNTPAAAIEWGTTQNQKTVFTTLAGLKKEIIKEDINPPSVVVIGAVVELAEKLEWFKPQCEEHVLDLSMPVDIKKEFFPVLFDLYRKRCLVVGGGPVAERKINLLLSYGAQVTVVAPRVSDMIKKLADTGEIDLILHKFEEKYLDGIYWLFVATSNKEVRGKIFMGDSKRNIPLNYVDNPKLCDFIIPATVKRGDLKISVSTSGSGPALAAILRHKLENIFGPEWEDSVADLASKRKEILAKEKDPVLRNKKIFKLAEKLLQEFNL